MKTELLTPKIARKIYFRIFHIGLKQKQDKHFWT